MQFNELRKYAREALGIVFSRTPKRQELEAAVAQAETARTAQNDPVQLRAQAQTLRNQAQDINTQAKAAEERAAAIETAQTDVNAAIGTLRFAMIRFRVSMTRLASLGLPVRWELPEEIVTDFIDRLTPPLRIFVFWVEGRHQAARGYVLAESFDQAKARWGNREVDFGHPYPGSCGWPAAIARDLAQLQEGGEFYDTEYQSTLRTITLTGELFEFILDGPEYEGRAVVNAQSFTEAKAKALAGDIIEGDCPDPEIVAELREALSTLQENSQVVQEGHTLTTKTIC